MKKIALLLAITMLLTFFASCGGDGEQSMTDETSVDDSASTSSGDDTKEELVIEYETVVSTGKTYTYGSVEPGASYPDSYNSELTDGVIAESTGYSGESFVGLAPGGSAITITMELGDDSGRVYKFGVSYLATREAGIGPLGSGNVLVSADGEKWSKAGSFSVPAYEDGTVQTAWVICEEVYEAKYVKFSLRASSAWLFLDELIVIADVKGNSASSIYFEKLAASYTNSPLEDGSIVLPTNGEAVDRTLNKYSATYGRNYTYSRSTDPKYSSSSMLLTDGIETGAAYNTDNWIGWTGNDDLVINVPLGITYHNIAELEISMLTQSALGIMLPYYVDFYVSSDNKEFSLVGRVYAPNDPQVTNYTYSVSFETGITAKYIRFVCAETECNFFFCEEINAAYYAESSVAGSVYEPVELEKADDKVYLSGASSKEVNLISGLDYQISSATELNPSVENQYNSKPNAGHLTDGKKSNTTSYTDSRWFKTHYGTARNIYFDLGYQAEISGLTVNFLRNIPVGIGLPGSVSLYLSDDGINWYNVATAPVPQTEEQLAISTAEYEIDKPVEARYIRITFGVAGHVYLDEIEVWGSKKVSSDALSLDEIDKAVETTGNFTAVSDDILGGLEDLMLAYMNESFDLDKDFFLPLVAYLDKEGNIKDTLFDGMLFLPTGSFPPNGNSYNNAENPTKAADWIFMADTVFKEGYYFDALEEAVGELKTALNLPDYKVKVYPSFIYLNLIGTKFGDLDGDGNPEDISTVEDAIEVYDWYVNEILTRFEAENYQNIEICGFYWFEEAVSYTDPTGDHKLINACSDVCEDYGYQLFWIPYYQARGFSEWSSYGFSVACMQPNYAFNAEVPANRLDSAVSNILQYGMGIEIEIDDKALTNKIYFRKYMNYLSYGIKYGYMNDSIHMYYAGTTIYNEACYSDDPANRSIYDRTYEFIKGTLGDIAPSVEDITFEVTAGSPFTGTLYEGNTKLLSGRVTVSAEHGCVTLNTDGTFTYYPNAGFTGTDTFTFVINDYIVDSEPATVTLNVK